MVVGSRGKGGSDELHGTLGQLIRYVGSQLIMLGINYLWNVRLTDSQNGFRAIKRDVGKRLSLTQAGRRLVAAALPLWERAKADLARELGERRLAATRRMSTSCHASAAGDRTGLSFTAPEGGSGGVRRRFGICAHR